MTLTDRTDMGVPMLLGRCQHRRGRFWCIPDDPSFSRPETQANMKIALLTRNPKLYSHQRLIEIGA